MKTNDSARQMIGGLGIASTALYRAMMAQAAIALTAIGVLAMVQ